MKRFLGLTMALALLAQVVGSCAPSAASPIVPQTPASLQSAATSRQISAEDLAKALVQKDFVLVNVHTPYQGEIDGTDLFLAYDQIGADLTKLPQDKGAKIVLY